MKNLLKQLKYSCFCDTIRKIIVDIYSEVIKMKISYKKLWIILAEHELSKQQLREGTEISLGTMTKLNKGEEVSLSILLKICNFLDCNIGDICDAVPDNSIKKNDMEVL